MDTEAEPIADSNDLKSVSKKENKPPPIFVSGVENISPLQEMLENIAPKAYFLKTLNNNQVRIQLENSTKYLTTMDALKKKNTQCYTYQLKEHRTFKVVLKGMHPAIDIKELSEEIEEKNHKVVKISNIFRSKSENGKIIKTPTSTFYVELEQRINNKEIYKIKHLMHMLVTFEPSYIKRDIVQYTRCQRYRHT